MSNLDKQNQTLTPKHQKTNEQILASPRPLRAAHKALMGNLLSIGLLNIGLLLLFLLTVALAILTLNNMLYPAYNPENSSFAFQVLRSIPITVVLTLTSLIAFLGAFRGFLRQCKSVKVNAKRIKTIRQTQRAQAGSISMSVDASHQGGLSQHQAASTGGLSQTQTVFDLDTIDDTKFKNEWAERVR